MKEAIYLLGYRFPSVAMFLGGKAEIPVFGYEKLRRELFIDQAFYDVVQLNVD